MIAGELQGLCSYMGVYRFCLYLIFLSFSCAGPAKFGFFFASIYNFFSEKKFVYLHDY